MNLSKLKYHDIAIMQWKSTVTFHGIIFQNKTVNELHMAHACVIKFLFTLAGVIVISVIL